MSNGDNERFLLKPETPLQKATAALSGLIDYTIALSAMCIEAGIFDSEQLFRMEAIIRDGRRKLGKDFTFDEGLKAVRAAFRIEIQSRKEKK